MSDRFVFDNCLRGKSNSQSGLLSPGERQRARRVLLRWFRRNARALPWRGSPTPYQVWLSEIMLQQTQVATVIPYYRRFLENFPTVKSLARAPLERVFELWSGLGYYRRARNLHSAAQVIVEKFRGQFPRDYHQARSLPGVGDYTARAVLSIAYNLPFAVMDGNVARVMARLEAVAGAPSDSAFRRTVERGLDLLLSRRTPGAFNQAMMELGQTVCLARAPKCPECPLRSWCRAGKLGQQVLFPAPKLRRAAEESHLAVAVIMKKGKVAMARGLADALLADMWNFPSAFGRTKTAALQNLTAKLNGIARRPVALNSTLGELRHNITFRSIRVNLLGFDVLKIRKPLRWFPLSRMRDAAISQLARKVASRITDSAE